MNDEAFISLAFFVAGIGLILLLSGDPYAAAILCGFMALVAFGRWSVNR